MPAFALVFEPQRIIVEPLCFFCCVDAFLTSVESAWNVKVCSTNQVEDAILNSQLSNSLSYRLHASCKKQGKRLHSLHTCEEIVALMSQSNKQQWNFTTYAMQEVLSCLPAYDNIVVDFPLERCSEDFWKLNITKLLGADHVRWRNLIFIVRSGPDPLGRMKDT